MRNLKRILALALTVLMVVGAVPMAVFAADSEGPVANATGKAYDSSYPNEFAYYANAIKSAYKSDASYWYSKSIHGLTLEKDKVYKNSNFNRKNILDGSPNSPDVPADFKPYGWDKNLAGLDMALSFELQAPDATTADNALQIRTFKNINDTTNPGFGFLMLKYVGGNHELWVYNNGNTTGYKIADIPKASTGEFIKVDVLFEVGGVSGNAFEQTKYYVFVDGELLAVDNWATTETHTGQYTAQKSWADEAGEDAKPMGIIFGALAFCEGKRGAYNMKNVGVYFYDDDADGDPTDSARGRSISTFAELKHYQDFNALTDETLPNGTKVNSILGGNIQASVNSGATVVDDGRGGKAITTDKDGDPYYAIQPNLPSGTNFVYSMDYKLLGNPQDNCCLFNGCAQNAYATTEYGRDFNLGMLYLHSDGGVYIGRKTDETSSGVIINGIGGNNKAQKICTLSKDRFINLAVAVNVKNNTYKIYVDGVEAFAGQFLTDTDYALLTGTNTQGKTPFANGFGLTFRRVNLRKYLAVDNVAVYTADDIVNKNTTPLNGIVKEGDKFYYYENGQVVPNSFAGETPYYTDKNGALIEDAYVTIGGKLYDFTNYVGVIVEGVKNNNLYIDGVIVKNGMYEYNGDYYLADANGALLTGLQTVEGEEWFFDATTFKGEKIVIEEGDNAIVDANTGTKYDDIKDALENIEEEGEIKIYGNMTIEESITIDKGITVNLNGNTITAPEITINSGTEIVVSADNKGYFNVPKGMLHIARNTDAVISYYEEGKGYTFATAKKQEKSEVPAPESEVIDGFTLTFRPSLDLDTEYNQKIFGNGNSGVRFEVHLRTSDGTTIKRFVVEDETLVQRVYNGKNAFKLTVRGASVKYSGQELHVVYVLNSDTGVQCEIASDVKFTPKALTE